MPESIGSNSNTGTISQTTVSPPAENHIIKWLRVILYAVIAVSGQTSGLLLSRLYYQKGGTSNWVESLTQVVGFPVLLPYYLYRCLKTGLPHSDPFVKPRLLLLVLVYVYMGLLMAANSLLYSIGFEYLPVSIFTLVSASQLAFNALFSYFLNSQKFTPFIINSLLLLAISSVLTVSNNTTGNLQGIANGNYALGFICTFSATAVYGLMLASQQLVFRKVFDNKQSQKLVMDLTIYPSFVASIFALIGFFVSGDHKLLIPEMDSYELGKASYVTTLVSTAVCWQVSIFAGLGLVSELSALFANCIFAVGLPVNIIAAFIVFKDEMDTAKGISMVLAIWGIISYAYQQYLDDYNDETKESEVSEV
ncbi:hypothetical protein like AT4G18220 [Hibiscus trionum]|uniref:Probable purine permease n=1 Tax=Hibiscus trionum TaxID=183268 RepID=A0A9W7H7E6_HIBTR|nr:hypothetical protein like AT4G18220 [Hibiscus trionum]